MDHDQSEDPARRTFLQSVAVGGAVAGLIAQGMGSHADAAEAAAPWNFNDAKKLGAGGAGEGKVKIAMLVHPKMVMQDHIGPLTCFNIMRAEIHLVWKNLEPTSTDVGMPVFPTTVFADCPKDLDILFVPGGIEGSLECMQDKEVLEFLADRAQRARYVTSDCTGALVLGAAGLLQGYKAAAHWQFIDYLSYMGAIPTHQRVVIDRNRITGGGVTAGIDFGLTLVSLIRGEEAAKRIQLLIEYNPAPPFDAGSPKSVPDLAERLNRMRANVRGRTRDLAELSGQKLGVTVKN